MGTKLWLPLGFRLRRPFVTAWRVLRNWWKPEPTPIYWTGRMVSSSKYLKGTLVD